MMKKSDIRALVKGLQKRAREDSGVQETVVNIDEITKILAEIEDEEPRIRVPYVNTSAIGTGTWK